MKVMVYGTLKRGHGNHRLLEGCPHVGDTTLTGYDMYSLGGFPGIKDGEGLIEVETYEINPLVLKLLDGLEGYRSGHPQHSMYIRRDLGDETYIYIYNGHVNPEDLLDENENGVRSW